MRAAIREYFGPDVPFVKTRAPAWLGGLELDCYNESLRLAFEYQGIQHYEFTPFFHNNDVKRFEAQLERDARKQELTSDEFVALIEIPYTIPRTQLRDHIRRELYFLGFDPVSEPAPYAEFMQQVMETGTLAAAMLEQARAIAVSHGGTCESKVYIDCHEPLQFICRLGHAFDTALADVNHRQHKRPRFCSECGGTRRRTFEENKNEMAQVGYALLAQYNVIIGTKNPKTRVILKSRCPAEHIVTMLRDNFFPLKNGKPRRSCRTCARRKTGRNSYSQRDNRCAALKVRPVGPYAQRHTPATWLCLVCGSEFVISWNSLILRRGGACQICKSMG